MSTHIETIWTLNVTRFWDGEEYSLQLTPEIFNNGYTQLNQKEVKELIEVLENAFDTKIYEHE